MSPEDSCQQQPASPTPGRLQNMSMRPPEPEHLPCPRCASTNTKFCYYNNYNLSQPRHFCKACRRYWTRGGTLRNVPVGGGTRKPSSATTKRSRSTATSSSTLTYDPILAIPTKPDIDFGFQLTRPASLNETAALVTVQQRVGFGPLADFGLGLRGSDFNGMSFGLGTWDWRMEQVNGSGGCNTWQIGGVEGGVSDGGDGFNWPELAISTPGQNLSK